MTPSMAWAAPALLVLASLTVWFVTTFVVLVPLLIPGMGIRPDLDASATGLAQFMGVLMLLLFQVLFGLFMVSAARAALTPPGDVPSWLRSDGKSDLHSYSNLLQAVERKSDGSPRFCRKTGAYKPDRAHFCPQLGRCVLQYQTFSAPLNAAVGFYNYKFFLLSLLYGSLCAAWVLASTLPEVAATWPPFSSAPAPRARPTLQQDGLSAQAVLAQLATLAASIASREAADQWVVDAAILVTLVLAVLALVPCTLSLFVHLWLVAKGRTHYEWRMLRAGKRPRGRSLFDYGLLNNLALTLGVYPLLWLLPVRTGIEGNGIFFPQQERAH